MLLHYLNVLDVVQDDSWALAKLQQAEGGRVEEVDALSHKNASSSPNHYGHFE